MLTALFDDEHIVAPRADRARVKHLSRIGRLVCPACRQPVIFYAGTKKMWYFGHKPGTSDCPLDDDPDYRPESDEHLRAKMLVYQWLTSRYPANHVTVEAFVDKTGQIADVLLLIPGTHRRIAFEVQRSRISGERWRERSELYAAAGIDDVWLLIGTEHTEVSHGKDHVAARVHDLPQTILRDRGRLLYLDVPEEDESAEATLAALHGIANHYDVSEIELAAHVEDLTKRDVADQPEWLRPGVGPWSEKEVSNSVAFGVGYVFETPLDEATVETEVGRSVLYASKAHQRADKDAWAWEEANRDWHESWKKRLEAREAERKREREAAFRDRDVLVGRGVFSSFSKLLPEALELKKQGAPQWRDSRLRSSKLLPEGVRKWPPHLWTPLADMKLPLDWIFGVDRRLWQMVVYCSQLYHHYVMPYRARYGINVDGYKLLTTGFALKALGYKKLLMGEHSERLVQTLTRLNAWTAQNAVLDRQGGFPTSIELHDVRHLVMAAYFDELKRHGHIYDYHNIEALPILRSLRLALNEAAKLQRQTSNRRLSNEDFACVGDKWLELAGEIEGVRDNKYSLRTPFIPPYFKPHVRQHLVEAMEQDALWVSDDGLYTDEGPIYELEWRKSKGSR